MSQPDVQSIQRIVHTELKKISEQLDRLEHMLGDFAKVARYDISWIKEHSLTKEDREQGRQTSKEPALDQSQAPALIHQELLRIIENNLPQLMERIIHQEVKTVTEELEYIKKHYPTTDALDRAAEELHTRIVTSLTPKEERLPPPLPHRPQI